ncbi:hypothetical protein PMHK_11970 [Pseudomonas sp. MHK4]|jgi:outer membrane protein
MDYRFVSFKQHPCRKARCRANDYSVDLMALHPKPRLEDLRSISTYKKARCASEQQRAALGGLLPRVSAI